MDKVRKLAYSAILLLFIAVGVLAYSYSLSPVTSEIVSTRYSTIPETRTIITTAGTLRSITTMTMFSYSAYGSGGPSCPYGGTYYVQIYTSLCGWQYDVCVTFDYNCSNDYHAVHAMYTATYRLITSSTRDVYVIQTMAVSSTTVLPLLETHTFTQLNPSFPITESIGGLIAIVGIAILLVALLLSSSFRHQRRSLAWRNLKAWA